MAAPLLGLFALFPLPPFRETLRPAQVGKDSSSLHASDRPISVTLSIRNRCDVALIDARFKPLIDEAITAYGETFGDRVRDLRLQGSVARGEAEIGLSDLDVMALLTEEPPQDDLEKLAGRAEELGHRYPMVSRVELDAVDIDQLTQFQRFVLSSDSLSVAGTDRLTRRSQRRNRRALAKLVTPDAALLIDDYRALMQEVAADPEATRFYGRIVAKDILKCMRSVVLHRGGTYEASAARLPDQVSQWVPELAGLADRLGAIYLRPSADAQIVIAAIDDAGATLLPLWLALTPALSRAGEGVLTSR
jgi:predicted nucleotidyltransferase